VGTYCQKLTNFQKNVFWLWFEESGVSGVPVVVSRLADRAPRRQGVGVREPDAKNASDKSWVLAL
jgi:hypothetical protein